MRTATRCCVDVGYSVSTQAVAVFLLCLLFVFVVVLNDLRWPPFIPVHTNVVACSFPRSLGATQKRYYHEECSSAVLDETNRCVAVIGLLGE
jgi:hypothetical protein